MKKLFLTLILALLGISFAAKAQDVYYITGGFNGFEYDLMTNENGKFTFTVPVGKNGFQITDSDDYTDVNAKYYGPTDRDAKISLNTPFPIAESNNMTNFSEDITAKEVLITFDPVAMTLVATDPNAPVASKAYITCSALNDYQDFAEMTYADGKYTYTLDIPGNNGLLLMYNDKLYGAKVAGTYITFGLPNDLAEGTNILYIRQDTGVKTAVVTFDPAAMTVTVKDPSRPDVPKPTTFYVYGGFNDWDATTAVEMTPYADFKKYEISSLPNTGFKILGQRGLDVNEWIFGAAEDNCLKSGVPFNLIAGADSKNFAFAEDVVSIANARLILDPATMTLKVDGYPVYANEPVPENLFIYGSVNDLNFNTTDAIKGARIGNTFIFSGIKVERNFRQTGLFAFTPLLSSDREGVIAGNQYGPKEESTPIDLDTPAPFGRNGYTFFEVPNGTYKLVVDFDNHTVTATRANVVDPNEKYYIWGTFNDEDAENAPEMKFENGVYTYKLDDVSAGFMISNMYATTSTGNYGVKNKEKAQLNTPLQTTSGTASADRFIYLDTNETLESVLVTFDTSDFTVIVSEYVPAPSYYVVGLFNDWDVENAPEMNREDDGTYTLAVDKMLNQFKIVGARAWVDAKTIGARAPYSITLGTPAGATVGGAEFGFANDVTSVEDATLTFNPDKMELTVTGTAISDQPELYLRGSMNDWVANDDTKMTYNADTHTYTIGEVEIAESNQFKIASANYDINFGGQTFTAESLRGLLSATSNNCSLTVAAAGKYDFEFSYVTKLLTITKSKVGIDTIDADTINGETQVYTLQGCRVYGQPTPGIYVVIRNGKASKISIR